MLVDVGPVIMSYIALLIPWILFAWSNKEHGPRALFTTTDFRIQRGKPTTLAWRHINTDLTRGVYVSITLVETTAAEHVLQVLNTSEYSWIREYSWIPPDSLSSGSYAFRVDPSIGRPDWSPTVFYDQDFVDPPTTKYLMPRTAICPWVMTTTLDVLTIGMDIGMYSNARPGASPRLPNATKGFHYPSLISAAALAAMTNLGIARRLSAYSGIGRNTVCVARHPLIDARPCPVVLPPLEPVIERRSKLF